VLNEPDVPAPPPPVDVHDVLLVDVQLTVVLAPDAIKVDPEVTDTVGAPAEPTVIVILCDTFPSAFEQVTV